MCLRLLSRLRPLAGTYDVKLSQKSKLDFLFKLPNFNGWTDQEVRRSKSKRRELLQTPSKKFKGDSRYTGSDNEDDDFNDFTMNKGFIHYN